MKSLVKISLAVLVLCIISCSAPDRSTPLSPPAAPASTRIVPTSTLPALPTEIVTPPQDIPTMSATDETLAVLEPSPTFSPAPNPTIPFRQVTAIVDVDLKVRKGPGTAYTVVGTLKKGTTITLLGTSQDRQWFQHAQGWSAGAYMTIRGDITQLPLVLESAPQPPTVAPTLIPQPTATKPPTPIVQAPPPSNCSPSYPTVCIPPPPPDLDCPDIPYRRFKVLSPDPHRFDGDHDGIGCES